MLPTFLPLLKLTDLPTNFLETIGDALTADITLLGHTLRYKWASHALITAVFYITGGECV